MKLVLLNLCLQFAGYLLRVPDLSTVRDVRGLSGHYAVTDVSPADYHTLRDVRGSSGHYAVTDVSPANFPTGF